MISRRTFNLALAATALPTAGALGAAIAEDGKVEFTAWVMPTAWHPVPALDHWLLDHTAVATSTGMEWGCFGRTYSDNPKGSSAVARGMGDEAWARAIAGPDGHAGINYGVTGVCDQCSNRILLPAGIDVRNSPGNEIAIMFCGVYGFGLDELVKRIKDGAAAVNKDKPGRISEQAVSDAVDRVGGGLKDELLIVRGDIERIIKPAVGAQYDALKGDIEDVYLSFYYKRTALYHAFERGTIDKAVLVGRLHDALAVSLEDLKAVVGAQDYAKIVPVPPQLASDYVFYKEKN